MSEEPDPPRKTYGFKPRDFETANTHPPMAPAPPPRPDPGIQPAAEGRIDVRDLALLAKVKPAATPPPPKPAGPASDVHAMLSENLAVANAAGLNRVAPTQGRPSKRKRDYVIVMVAGNGGLLTLFAVVIGFNLFSCLFLAAGMIFFSSAATWIMWHVMDDY